MQECMQSYGWHRRSIIINNPGYRHRKGYLYFSIPTVIYQFLFTDESPKKLGNKCSIREPGFLVLLYLIMKMAGIARLLYLP